MFDVARINQEFENVVGFENHYNTTDVPALSPNLLISDSGKFINYAYSPYMNLQTIVECLPKDLPLSTFLEDTRKGAILDVLQDLQEIKGLEGKALLNSTLLFDGVGFAGDAIVNTGRLCGLQVKVKPNIGLTAVIDAISLQLNAVDTTTIYIYHSSQSNAIATINYNSGANGINWESSNIQMGAENDIVKGGYYYITYYQDDLTARAIPYKKYSFNTGVCGTCNGGQSNALFDAQKPHFEIKPFYVGSAGLDLVNRTKFDESLIVYEDDKNNYGLNLKLSVKCDLTQFYIDNKLMVADAIMSKILIKVMEQQFASKTINQTNSDIKITLQINLFGDANTKEKSFIQKYKDSLKMLNLNFSSINNSCIKCLPEYQKQSVGYSFF